MLFRVCDGWSVLAASWLQRQFSHDMRPLTTRNSLPQATNTKPINANAKHLPQHTHRQTNTHKPTRTKTRRQVNIPKHATTRTPSTKTPDRVWLLRTDAWLNSAESTGVFQKACSGAAACPHCLPFDLLMTLPAQAESLSALSEGSL